MSNAKETIKLLKEGQKVFSQLTEKFSDLVNELENNSTSKEPTKRASKKRMPSITTVSVPVKTAKRMASKRSSSSASASTSVPVSSSKTIKTKSATKSSKSLAEKTFGKKTTEMSKEELKVYNTWMRYRSYHNIDITYKQYLKKKKSINRTK